MIGVRCRVTVCEPFTKQVPHDFYTMLERYKFVLKIDLFRWRTFKRKVSNGYSGNHKAVKTVNGLEFIVTCRLNDVRKKLTEALNHTLSSENGFRIEVLKCSRNELYLEQCPCCARGLIREQLFGPILSDGNCPSYLFLPMDPLADLKKQLPNITCESTGSALADIRKMFEHE